MTDEWLEAMDKGHYTGLLFLDFHKAFDLIHDILFKKLAVYGFSQFAVNWIKSYLTNRCQKVFRSRHYIMGSLKVLSWAPLFLLFINDLAINQSNNSGLYVDDATVYMSAPNLSTIQQNLQADINIILK